ncbi:protein HIRA-like isoform X2 [Physella acuta]|uniref:protein HIRA-like isoform X2 n=1 Tax=Physella acuta TaxID=109671 RepID=UPI0027DE5018|nr:protein HIRA-like isoform X2 [Physella acuta]
MRVVKPGWIHHDGKPIFSVDIHPDGSRCATGGQGNDYGKIVIWNMEPVRNGALEDDEKVPKMLCQMDHHLACVNCVRWSHSGKFLASGGDDKLIMIWQTSRGAGPAKAFGSTGSVVIHEQWRPVFTLRGHSGDVLDLNWSPQDVWLATCSVDNTVIIWNALKFPEQLTALRGHSGLVKGVTWDPVGKYVASQSDDRTLRIWRTMDWKQEAIIEEPFKECSGTTHSLRLNWSPDGHHIVSAHAMNNSGPTAQIIERSGFKASLDFVGHRKAITVVRFNPNIFSKKFKGEKSQQYSCCAIGSKDRSLSIWLTALKRPLVVMHDLFENSILDLTWSQNGLELMSCSSDGSVAFMDFSKDEIGNPLSKDEVTNLLENIYGKGISLHASATKGSQIIESAAMLNLHQQKNRSNDVMLTPTKHSNLSSQMSASGDKTPFKSSDRILLLQPTDKQIETRTADGRRRITPIFLAPQPEVGEVPLPFSSNSNIEFHSSSELSKIVVEKQNRVTAPGMMSPSSGSVPSSPPHLQTPPSGSTAAKDAQKAQGETSSEGPANKINFDTPLEKLSAVSVDKTPQQEKPDKTSQQTVSDKPKAQEKEAEKDSSLVKDKLKSRLSGSLSLKRKREEDKRKRGRPSKMDQAMREAAMSAAAAEAVSSISTVNRLEAPAAPAVAGPQQRVQAPTPDLHLPAMSIDKAVSQVIQGLLGDAEALVLEVENGLELGTGKVHRLRCIKGGKILWDQMFTSKICATAGSVHVLCAACVDGTVSVFSKCGRRIFPFLVVGAQPAFLICQGHYLLVVTTKGTLFVWNCSLLKVEIKQESLSAVASEKDSVDKIVLTTEGVPIVTLTNKKSYSYSVNIGCWVLVSDGEDRLQSFANHHQCMSTKLKPSEPLASLQKSSRTSDLASRSFQSNPGIQQSLTLSHLESQMASSLALLSANEYKFWLETYIRYLAQEGVEEKLREICDELLGPVYRSSRSSSTWSQNVLGLDKHVILRNILPYIGADLKFQRLYTEYKEQLDMQQP